MQSVGEVTIRHPRTDEHESVRELIRIVANETFAGLFAPNSDVMLELAKSNNAQLR
jgi:hypothetical protein